MTLQQLTYFLAAFEHGSFSAGADALHMAQPSLSDQVRRLEAELGVALFVRVGRGLEPTEAAHELRPHAERLLAGAGDARAAIAGVRELRGGTASFGTFGDAPYYGLADLVARFTERFPGVALRVVGQNSLEVADAVRNGRLEAGLIVLPVDDAGLDVEPALRGEVLYTSAHPANVREPVTIEEFARRPTVLYDARYGWSDPTRRLLLERAQRRGLKIEPRVEVEHLMAALQTAARGVADTIVDELVATGPDFPTELSTVSFAEPLFNDFAFITRRGASLSPASRELVSIARSLVLDLAGRLGSRPGAASRPAARRSRRAARAGGGRRASG
jgi:DNA-binding transcriptional LysR family regulator